MSQQQRPRDKYNSIPLRRSATQQYDMRHTTGAQIPASYVSSKAMPPMVDDDDAQIIPRTPAGVVRYTDEYGRPVVQQGNRRFVMHKEPPPQARRNGRQPINRGKHWLFIFGVGMVAMLLLVLLAEWAVSAWQNHQLDSQYGIPRTYQTDAVVGHGGDSQTHPSHFIFENLRGQVIIIELPAGKIKDTIIYAGPQIVTGDVDGTPVTGSFETINGQIDMLVKVGDGQPIIYTNNGTKFVPPAQTGS